MIELNEANFAEYANQGLCIVDFYAPWCGPCRVLAPTLENIQGCNLYKVNIDECIDVTAEFRISSIPTLVFLKDGVEVERMVGVSTQSAIQGKVDSLNAPSS